MPVDVRVIAATNVDLEAAVAAGQFRQDLFFRLNVATVSLPPLRDRPGDIPPLANHFLDVYRGRMGRPSLALSAQALAALAAYSWPGNIRELENVIHNAVLLAAGPGIEPLDLRLSRGPAGAAASTADATDELRAVIERLLASGESNLFARVTGLLVKAAFEMSGGSQVGGAERLGISRNAMRTQLAHLDIIAGRPPRKRKAGSPDHAA